MPDFAKPTHDPSDIDTILGAYCEVGRTNLPFIPRPVIPETLFLTLLFAVCAGRTGTGGGLVMGC